MKGTENEARTINQNQMFPGAHAATCMIENDKLRISFYGYAIIRHPGGADLRPYWPARPEDAILFR
ncbi:hypothetical protein AA0311_0121 [Asaia bogorensis NBRC 16594]|uniref:Uncharacterized protein n=1 Tax=Asaia bogorensis NBRC 16594 TaxID=1231624 RepID=A0AAN4U2B9_9PROT|nr:hypothetical protein AA0311_0121 [Asaia bogorensis NBRC 16594]GEL53474.1 hypothetical protein ABO01nite_14810 [Asaia bogorensis NBRC 16594]